MQNPFDPGYFQSEELRSFGFKSVGQNVRIARNCVIIGLENIEIGDDCRIDCFTRIFATGPLSIGNYVHIHSGCLLGSRGGLVMDDYSAMSHDCRVITATDDFDGEYLVGGVIPARFTRPIIAPVRMGCHSALAMNVTVLPGVTIGAGAVISVHSVVTRSAEPWGIYAGTPARRIHRRSLGLLAHQAEIEGHRTAA